jgi:phosphatidylethanolamine/phosphatidyl-N-methylethanolamine N-methyltransferase
MKENLQFLQAFLKNPLKVGAIAPSSPELAAEMLSGIEPDEDNIVLELGVGTGAITKFLRNVIPNRQSYLGIEIDAHLVRALNRTYPDLNIVCGNAAEAYSIHSEQGLGKVRHLICCLPFVSLPKDVSEQVLGEIAKFMDEGCELRLFQYAHGYYLPPARKLREFLKRRYGKSRRSPLILKNVPPAYTFTWTTIQPART